MKKQKIIVEYNETNGFMEDELIFALKHIQQQYPKDIKLTLPKFVGGEES